MTIDVEELKTMKCCAMVYNQNGWGSHACGNKAKMFHDGKAYCGIHDPIKAKAIADEKQRKFDAEWEEKAAKAKRQKQLIEYGEIYEKLLETNPDVLKLLDGKHTIIPLASEEKLIFKSVEFTACDSTVTKDLKYSREILEPDVSPEAQEDYYSTGGGE